MKRITISNMADLQPAGGKQPDEKPGKNGAEKAGPGPGEKGKSRPGQSNAEKNAIQRRRRFQRKKFFRDLQTSAREKSGQGGPPKPGPEKGPQKSAPKEGAQKERISARQQFTPKERPPQRELSAQKEQSVKQERTPREPLKEETAGEQPRRTGEEIQPRAQQAGREEFKPAKPTEEARKETEKVLPEKEASPAVEVPAHGEAPKEEAPKEEAPKEEASKEAVPEARTYFAHPFGDVEEEENKEEEKTEKPQGGSTDGKPQGGSTDEKPQGGFTDEELRATSLAEEEPLQKPLAAEEEQPTPLQEDEMQVIQPSEEEEIMIGTPPEKAPPIPVGRLREEHPEEDRADEEKESLMQKEEEKHEEDVNEPVRKERKKAEVSAIMEEEKEKTEFLSEKKPMTKKLQDWFPEIWKKLSAGAPGAMSSARAAGGRLGSIFRPGMIITVLLLAALAGGGYWAYLQGWPGKAVSYVSGFFTPKTQETITVNVNPADQRQFGLITAGIFSRNLGSVNDVLPLAVKLADYFGNRLEPAVKGETGISAATFYGELKDEAAAVNQFVVYMNNLQDMQNLYKVDVYAMLDRSSTRDKVLLDYLDQLKKSRQKSQDLLSEIKTDLDNFNVSYQSLNPDKTRYENDFFTAMDALDAVKSDMLLKGFIDISQKQTALKARINALNKLVIYYTAALSHMDIRITAIEQNKDALIQGIHVVNIPGANLNIIINPATSTPVSGGP